MKNAKGAVVVWTGDSRTLPLSYRMFADEAEIQPPFALPMRLGKGSVTVSVNGSVVMTK